jgi:hypothetical protein
MFCPPAAKLAACLRMCRGVASTMNSGTVRKLKETRLAIRRKPRSCIHFRVTASELLVASVGFRALSATGTRPRLHAFALESRSQAAGRMCGRAPSVLLDPAVLHIGLQKKY